MKMNNNDIVGLACQDYWKELRFYMSWAGDWEIKPWEETTAQSQMITRLHFLDHILYGGLTPKQEHKSWVETKRLCGFRKAGRLYSTKAKLHPMLMPYHMLPPWFQKVPSIVCDVFARHVPMVKEHIREIERI
jgi:hypothetical protein